LKSFVIAATQSGSGKTLITLAFLATFMKKGYKTQPFKVGPDFIDPGHHKKITGRDSINLDSWMLTPEQNKTLFQSYSNKDCDIAVIEGVMGLFDGMSRGSSTADIAKILDLPALLIIDASSMAESVGAIFNGFLRYDDKIKIKWVLFNKVSSEKHKKLILKGMERIKGDFNVLGFLPRNTDLQIPHRHLGLFTSDETDYDVDFKEKLAVFLDNNIDIDRFVETIPQISTENNLNYKTEDKKDKICRIGVARDRAFCFYYPDNIRLLEEMGAKIVYFSPVYDTELPYDIHGLYFGGGYPELYAEQLSKNSVMIKKIRELSQNKIPIYAECGGLMYLSRYIYINNDEKYEMPGIIPVNVRMLEKRKALGYREVELQNDCILGEKGLRARGHEFHYSEIMEQEGANNLYLLYSDLISDNANLNPRKEGFMSDNIAASYVHIHFLSQPLFAKNFVEACMKFWKPKPY
jgi:cobyrinic acid a,c-diamide synthase